MLIEIANKTKYIINGVSNIFARRMLQVKYGIFGPIRILFIVRNSLGMSCLLPIIEEAKKRKKIKIAITIEFAGCYDSSIDEVSRQLFSKYYSHPDECESMQWHYIFTTDFTNSKFKKFSTLIYTQHSNGYGMLDKTDLATCDYTRNLMQAGRHHIVFCNSHGDYSEFSSYSNTKSFFISGFPKLDGYVNNALLTKNQDQPIELNPKYKTIVIASHWNPKSLLNTFGADLVKGIVYSESRYNIIITGHGNLWQNSPTIYNELKKLDESLPYFHFLPNVSSNYFILKNADIFIGDTSSIFIEFCLFDKPIIFFEHKDFVFSNTTVEKLYRAASIKLEILADLPGIIELALISDNLSDQRKQVVQHFLSKIGNAASYTIDVIEKLSGTMMPVFPSYRRIKRLSKKELSKN